MKQVTFPSGLRVPALGQGTWRMGQHQDKHAEEVAAIRLGIDLGLTLIDTAEMYGEDARRAWSAKRSRACATRSSSSPRSTPTTPRGRKCTAPATTACKGCRPRPSTCTCCTGRAGCLSTKPCRPSRHCNATARSATGVSVDLKLMKTLWELPGGAAVQTGQVLYNLGTRGIGWGLLPWLLEHRVPVMAYSPFDEGRLLHHRALVAFAKQHAMTPSQAALAWLLAQDGVIVIPKTGQRERARENAAALEHRLTAAHLRELDALFLPPRGPSPLEMI